MEKINPKIIEYNKNYEKLIEEIKKEYHFDENPIKLIKETYNLDLNPLEMNLDSFKNEIEEKLFRADLGKKDWNEKKQNFFFNLIKKLKLDKKDYDFKGYVFPKISFAGIDFDGDVDFSDLIIGSTPDDIDTKSTIFNGDANFRRATFSGEANFEHAIFSGRADFLNGTFSGGADFLEATFNGEAYFREATFNGDANFSEAEFNGDANFSEAEFSGDAYFFCAIFNGKAYFNFIGAIFSKKINFKYIEDVFYKCLFLNSNIYEIDYGNYKWQNTKLYDETFLEEKIKELKTTKDEEKIEEFEYELGESVEDYYEDLQRLYCEFKRKYEKLGQRQIADRFFEREMDVRHKKLKYIGIKGYTERFLLFFYKTFSNYGQEFFRTVIWIFGVMVLGGFIIGLDPYPNANGFGNGLLLSVRAFSYQKDDIFADLKPLSKWTITVLFMLSPILLSLLVLAIKRKFKR